MDFRPDDSVQAVAGLAAEVLRGEAGTGQAWPALAKAGLLAVALPEDLDGDGLGTGGVCALLTEVGRAAAPVPALATLALGVLPLAELATAEQRAAWLPGAATGDELLTAALHEPSRPFPARPAVSARSDRGWTLSGTKTGVPYAAEAARTVVTATAEDGEPAVFVVDGPVDAAASHAAGATPEYTVRFDGTPAQRLGPDVAAVYRFATLGALAVGDGALAGALDLTTAHLASRHQFGRPLAAFQAVAGQVADVYIAARTVHLATLTAGWTGDQSDVDIAAYWFADQAPLAMATCHHLHGGLGVDADYPLHRYSSLVADLVRFTGGQTERLARVEV
ncbi:acyl-CoA dehydrogenase family protein [Amycolatopsis suaedae]|uniref:Acyl-CoA dehydrogenase n=1 Tax=Amycolatopsis suaedae TaxID=2510978 RepID=A0A4Q7J8I1_9PSEU|nr:acyl-CoA dehydrogenase family protein [Amycolatopsis suaedae]RZQ63152.1 acyl-CoA dehydrogenase [Amycolatopsis suaedae]